MKNCRVLIVDDQPDNADSLSMILQLEGYHARTCYSGKEAIQLAREFAPHIALIDLGMPTVTGLDVARAVRDSLPGCVLVALTGYHGDEVKDNGEKAGFKHFLTKPADIRQIKDILINECA